MDFTSQGAKCDFQTQNITLHHPATNPSHAGQSQPIVCAEAFVSAIYGLWGGGVHDTDISLEFVTEARPKWRSVGINNKNNGG